jgi:hypothetical protein
MANVYCRLGLRPFEQSATRGTAPLKRLLALGIGRNETRHRTTADCDQIGLTLPHATQQPRQ